MPWVPGAHKGEKNYRVPRSSLLLARAGLLILPRFVILPMSYPA